jgi:protein TonB
VVKARLSIDAAGRVTSVDVLDAQPRRVFERAVTRTLARWTFEPGAAGRSTGIEVAFRRG